MSGPPKSAKPLSQSLKRISESSELPIMQGILEVDTSKSSVTIFMKPAPAHLNTETLTITKVSSDHNMVYLFSDSTLINKAEIVIFGLPSYAKVPGAKVKTLVLQSDGTNWKIIKET